MQLEPSDSATLYNYAGLLEGLLLKPHQTQRPQAESASDGLNGQTASTVAQDLKGVEAQRARSHEHVTSCEEEVEQEETLKQYAAEALSLYQRAVASSPADVPSLLALARLTSEYNMPAYGILESALSERGEGSGTAFPQPGDGGGRVGATGRRELCRVHASALRQLVQLVGVHEQELEDDDVSGRMQAGPGGLSAAGLVELGNLLWDAATNSRQRQRALNAYSQALALSPSHPHALLASAALLLVEAVSAGGDAMEGGVCEHEDEGGTCGRSCAGPGAILNGAFARALTYQLARSLYLSPVRALSLSHTLHALAHNGSNARSCRSGCKPRCRCDGSGHAHARPSG